MAAGGGAVPVANESVGGRFPVGTLGGTIRSGKVQTGRWRIRKRGVTVRDGSTGSTAAPAPYLIAHTPAAGQNLRGHGGSPGSPAAGSQSVWGSGGCPRSARGPVGAAWRRPECPGWGTSFRPTKRSPGVRFSSDHRVSTRSSLCSRCSAGDLIGSVVPGYRVRPHGSVRSYPVMTYDRPYQTV